jgi:kynureninase
MYGILKTKTCKKTLLKYKKITIFSIDLNKKGEVCLRTEDIITKLNEEGDEIALVILSGIQYYTGQLFQIKEITQAAHKNVYKKLLI